jgi:hypothetical protein
LLPTSLAQQIKQKESANMCGFCGFTGNVENKEQVINNIIQSINKKNVIIEDMDNSIDVVFEKDKVIAYKHAKPYKKYPISYHLDYEQLSEDRVNNRLVDELSIIIDFEGPIAYTLLLERFKEILGITKAGARVKRIFDKTLSSVNRKKKTELSQIIYFSNDSLIDEVENYRISEKLERDILEVPACEIKLAMIDILELQGSIKYDDIAHILASFFGIKALSQTNQEKLNKLIKYVILNSNEFIIKDNLPLGDWEWDELANKWDERELEDWGLDVWVNDADDTSVEEPTPEEPIAEQEPRTEKGSVTIVYDPKQEPLLSMILGVEITKDQYTLNEILKQR